MNHGSNTSNHHPLHPRDDREALSALFDGELPSDAARFALKRLDHDAGWRDTCGRWQLIGDALRGEATSAAPADFAANLMRKLAAEGSVMTTSPVAPVMGEVPATVVSRRRRWLGGAALAASVAMVAVMVARPFSQPPPAQPQVASGVVTPSVSPVRMTQESQATPAGAPAASPSPIATLAVANASRASSVPPRRAVHSARTATRPTPSSVNDTAMVVAATAHKPFHPPTADGVATRPWPRAVLPDAGAAGAFNVGFDAGSAPTSSYYPFEPRLPETATTKPPAIEPQH